MDAMPACSSWAKSSSACVGTSGSVGTAGLGRSGPEELGVVVECDAAGPVEVDAGGGDIVVAENSPSMSGDD